MEYHVISDYIYGAMYHSHWFIIAGIRQRGASVWSIGFYANQIICRLLGPSKRSSLQSKRGNYSWLGFIFDVIGHDNLGIILLVNGNSQWCSYNPQSVLICCSTLSQEYCKLIGLYCKLMRRPRWTLTCPISVVWTFVRYELVPQKTQVTLFGCYFCF